MSLVVQPSLFGFSGEPGWPASVMPSSAGPSPTAPGSIYGRVSSPRLIELFDALVSSVPWHEERMRMYDSTVRVPRLLARYQGRANRCHTPSSTKPDRR